MQLIIYLSTITSRCGQQEIAGIETVNRSRVRMTIGINYVETISSLLGKFDYREISWMACPFLLLLRFFSLILTLIYQHYKH